MSEQPPSLHLFQLHFIFLQTNTEITGGGLSIRVIMSLKHLKAFGRPDTRRCRGPEEQGGITEAIKTNCKYKIMAFDWLRNWKWHFIWITRISSTREDCTELSRRSRTISFTDPECFRNMEGLMRIQWTSESHIKALLQAAGWPSAPLWHKQRGHVPPLSAEGTPPHNFTEQGSLAPYRWSVVLVSGICLSGTTPYSQPPVTARMWNNLDDLLDRTGEYWNQINKSKSPV